MATPPHIDIDSLLQPLSGDDPAGSSIPFVLRKKLDDARKEVNPDSFAADDPRRPEQPIVADWPAIQEMTQEGLREKSKDLMLAARLTEALAKQHGFGGVRDGLQLLKRMVDECWDRIYPLIEEGDLEPRAAAFNWLADPDRGAFFPNTVRHIPIVNLGGAGFGWQHWRDLQDGKGTVEKADFDKAIVATPRESCVDIVEDVQSCVAEVDALGELIDKKLGDSSPTLGAIRKALTDCQTLASEILARKGPAPGAAEETAEEPATASEKSAGSRRMNTREEVYARLAEASEQLMQMEPHSPVAYMIQRAVKLGHMSLPELIKVLIRDADVLKQLNRDLDLGYEEQSE